MPSRVLKTINVKITTREALWTEIYTSALESGFSPAVASLETDKAVDLIFDKIGPEKEARLRKLYSREKPRVRPTFQLERSGLRDSQPN